MALGELLVEAKGKVIGVRVLPDGKIENTFQGSGKIIGTDMNDIGTFWVQARPDGSFYGEGQVVLMAKEGSAMYKGSGVGKPTGRSPAAKIRFYSGPRSNQCRRRGQDSYASISWANTNRMRTETTTIRSGSGNLEARSTGNP